MLELVVFGLLKVQFFQFINVALCWSSDKVYRAVDASNAEQGNTYHAVGGAAGTVSPMGWTFQGGLAGTQGGRMYGLGGMCALSENRQL